MVRATLELKPARTIVATTVATITASTVAGLPHDAPKSTSVAPQVMRSPHSPSSETAATLPAMTADGDVGVARIRSSVPSTRS